MSYILINYFGGIITNNNTVGMITDITRSSTHDGPGIRTVVFLKGCPLNCAWCHNPECISGEIQVLHYPEKCIGCGMCEQGCFAGAKVVCGMEMTVSSVMEPILADRGYYKNGGGVTISGGEPMMQREFTSALVDACKAEGIHTGVETSFIIYDEDIFKKLDLIMFDLKLPDDERHKKWTGVPVSKIKENILRAAELGIPMLARTPVVPGVNADSETIGEISEFLRAIPAVYKYELLAYHPLGISKRRALNIPEIEFEIPKKQLMEELKHYAFVR